MLACIGGLLIAIWLVVYSQEPPPPTLTLIIGVLAGALFLLELVKPYWPGRPAP